jgi:hypothetical protein
MGCSAGGMRVELAAAAAARRATSPAGGWCESESGTATCADGVGSAAGADAGKAAASAAAGAAITEGATSSEADAAVPSLQFQRWLIARLFACLRAVFFHRRLAAGGAARMAAGSDADALALT